MARIRRNGPLAQILGENCCASAPFGNAIPNERGINRGNTFRFRVMGHAIRICIPRVVLQFQIATTTVRVNVPARYQLFEKLRARIQAGQGFSLATINLDHLVKLRHDTPFRLAYGAQDFVVADGNPIVWLSKLAKRPVELIPGSELVVPLSEMAADCGATVALLGSTEDALNRAAEGLCDRIPGLQIVAQIAPPMGFDPLGEDAAQMLQDIDQSGAQLCFLALGAPKQEILAVRGRAIAPKTGFVSIGAGLDFIAGNQTRAPKWVRAIAMEWVWRMALSPARLVPRYARCIAILPAEVRAARELGRSA